MTQPLVGTTPAAGGYLDVDNRFQGGHRTGLIAVLFRDARGADTNISPHNPNGTVRWSPFAQDGQLRNDLFAVKRVDGFWVPNEDENEGWYLTGAFGEGNGITSKPKITVDKQMIEQSNRPFETEKTEQEDPFSFSILQNLMPWNVRLRNDLPLVDVDGNSLVEAPGEVDAGWAESLEATEVQRQFLLYSIRKKSGRYLYEVEAYDCAKLTDLSEYQRGKKGKAAELTFDPEPSGFYMGVVDGEYKPIAKYTHVGGDAWESLADDGS